MNLFELYIILFLLFSLEIRFLEFKREFKSKFFNNFIGILSSSVIKLILKNGYNSIDPKLSKDKSLFLYIKLFTFKEDVS